jgi:hypothetical protein
MHGARIFTSFGRDPKLYAEFGTRGFGSETGTVLKTGDASDIRPFFICGLRPDTRLPYRISGKVGSYRISGYCLADPKIY